MNYVSQFFKSSYLLLAIAFILYSYQVDVPLVYSKHFGVYDARNIPVFAFFDFYTLIWFFALPISINKLIFRGTLKDLGIAFPKNKILALFLTVTALLLLIPFIIHFAKQNQFQGYSLGSPSLAKFTFMVTVLFPFYYLGEECFFRGFLFLGLWKRVGWHSFWITDILFTLSHIGKPLPEILLCIQASVIFNCLTLFTRSILPAVIVHSTMGIVLSVLVTFHMGMMH